MKQMATHKPKSDAEPEIMSSGLRLGSCSGRLGGGKEGGEISEDGKAGGGLSSRLGGESLEGGEISGDGEAGAGETMRRVLLFGFCSGRLGGGEEGGGEISEDGVEAGAGVVQLSFLPLARNAS